MPLLNVIPKAKPRMTKSDKWKNRPIVVDYWQYKTELTNAANRIGYQLPAEFKVTFLVEMPGSWSGKQRARMEGQPHQQTPDLDNYLKALNDSLAPENDSHIWRIEAEKIWAGRGGVLLGDASPREPLWIVEGGKLRPGSRLEVVEVSSQTIKVKVIG